jgi:hypothetical protein
VLFAGFGRLILDHDLRTLTLLLLHDYLLLQILLLLLKDLLLNWGFCLANIYSCGGGVKWFSVFFVDLVLETNYFYVFACSGRGWLLHVRVEFYSLNCRDQLRLVLNWHYRCVTTDRLRRRNHSVIRCGRALLEDSQLWAWCLRVCSFAGDFRARRVALITVIDNVPAQEVPVNIRTFARLYNFYPLFTFLLEHIRILTILRVSCCQARRWVTVSDTSFRLCSLYEIINPDDFDLRRAMVLNLVCAFCWLTHHF